MELKKNKITLIAEVKFSTTNKIYDYFISQDETEMVLSCLYDNDFCFDAAGVARGSLSLDEIFEAEQNMASVNIRKIRLVKFLDLSIGREHKAIRTLNWIGSVREVGTLTPIRLLDLTINADIEKAFPFGKNILTDLKQLLFIEEENKDNKKGDKTMKNLKNKFKIPGMENVGMKIDGAFAISMLSGKIAAKMGESYFSYDVENGLLSDESNMVIELPFPGMVLPSQVKDLKPGDVLFMSNELVFVSKVRDSGSKYTVIGANGVERDINKVSNAMMKDITFVEKVMNPFSGMNLGGGDTSNIFSNPMVVMAMLDVDSEDSKFGGDSMMKMMLMSQMMSGMNK